MNNEYGRRVIGFCAERSLCMGKTHFMRKYIHNYTRWEGRRRVMEGKSMTELVLVGKEMMEYTTMGIR